MNQCFETARPDDFTTGINLLAEKDPRPPNHKVTDTFTDGQLYIPNVQIPSVRHQSQATKTAERRKSTLLPPSVTRAQKKPKKDVHKGFGKLMDDAQLKKTYEGMLEAYQKGEKAKAAILTDFSEKLEKAAVVKVQQGEK